MKTEVIAGGISFLKNDYEAVLDKKKFINDFLLKYLIQRQNANQQISLLLEDLNKADGGGPKVTLLSLEGNLNANEIAGKIDIAYQLKLEWGCEAIKKNILKHEKFDFEIDVDKSKLFLYLFIPS